MFADIDVRYAAMPPPLLAASYIDADDAFLFLCLAFDA